MANGPVRSLRSVMRLTNGTFASIERHFPNLPDTAENAPVPMWPDMLGLADLPDRRRNRIYPWDTPIHLRMLGIANHSDDEFNGGRVTSLLSLLSHLWDEDEECPPDFDTYLPISPSSMGGEEANEAENIGRFGAIGEPVFPGDYGDDWSDEGSEFDDDYDSDDYYDSGFNTDSEADSNSDWEIEY